MSTNQNMVEQLAIKAKNGDKEATLILLDKFNPLICKISKQIYLRYGKVFPLCDIIKQARCLLIQLTVLVYTSGGKAHYPYFLYKSIHAELVKIYRPIYTFTYKSTPINESIFTSPPSIEYIFQDERLEICDRLIKETECLFSERDKEIINDIYNGIPRNAMARKYNISYTRMKIIHNKIIEKLRQGLSKLGIHKLGDL